MKIITKYADLTTALAEVTPVLADKLTPEDQKNIIFWVKDNKVQVVCNNLYTTCIADLAATVTFDANEDASTEQYVQVKAKELSGYLSGMTGLKMTTIDSVEFDIRENEIRLLMHEVPLNADDEGATKFQQTSKYRLVKGKVVERIKNELNNAYQHMTSEADFITIQKSDIMLMLNALLPAVNKEVRDSVHTRLTFADDFVYVIPQTYAALMRNCLPKEMSDFIITNSVGSFMQSFFAIEETTRFKKFATTGDVVVIVLKNSNATAVIKAATSAKAFNIKNQKTLPSNGIAVNKAYFADVLKRINITNTEITFKIKLASTEGEETTCMIVNKAMTQNIPVVAGKGTGDFSFTIKPDLLSAITFNSVTTGGTLLFFYLETDENGKITLCVTDDVMVNTGEGNLWHTSTRGLAVTKGDYQWN